ncbi:MULTISPECIES: hypothetical protein [unclassified Microcystis]|uniref:hypothetical protein n=1 Tax=unclassified Microcystis TaxID=2643300 RepID=UPI00118EF2AD|nr:MULTISPECIES: hypothetical protein [unclassified Microcystis]TRT69476.1 MAG: hypothetical protein EWV67_00090 [Microcystis sp. M_QC_C_20170808_M2Col]TRT70771.1 MAG: hypothetical protein EWV68_06000 [Microcystis sp. M_QC_C_20170808_M9Col]
MTLALDHNTYNQLLTKFQPKIIENEEEYEQARHLLLNLISKQDRLPEETAMVKLMATIKYLGKINYTYLTPLLPLASCLLPIFTRKLILHDYLLRILMPDNLNPNQLHRRKYYYT